MNNYKTLKNNYQNITGDILILDKTISDFLFFLLLHVLFKKNKKTFSNAEYTFLKIFEALDNRKEHFLLKLLIYF